MALYDSDMEGWCELCVRVLCPSCETTEEQFMLGTLDSVHEGVVIGNMTEAGLLSVGWRWNSDGLIVCRACQVKDMDGLEADYRRDLYEERRLEEEFDD